MAIEGDLEAAAALGDCAFVRPASASP